MHKGICISSAVKGATHSCTSFCKLRPLVQSAAECASCPRIWTSATTTISTKLLKRCITRLRTMHTLQADRSRYRIQSCHSLQHVQVPETEFIHRSSICQWRLQALHGQLPLLSMLFRCMHHFCVHQTTPRSIISIITGGLKMCMFMPWAPH